jgi:hypothetical protein
MTSATGFTDVQINKCFVHQAQMLFVFYFLLLKYTIPIVSFVELEYHVITIVIVIDRYKTCLLYHEVHLYVYNNMTGRMNTREP